MLIGSIGTGKPPIFHRGIRQIRALYNAHAAEPVDDKTMYKIIDRARRHGVDLVGHDGTTLIAEEGRFLRGLLEIANAA